MGEENLKERKTFKEVEENKSEERRREINLKETS